jgi:hypothetical protein
VTREELRVFLDGWFCGCGEPEAAAVELLALLRAHPLHQDRAGMKLIEDLGDGRAFLVLYTLEHFELTEHGGIVSGGWLTDKGRAVMEALEREEAGFDAEREEMPFDALFGPHCAHGFDITDVTHDCMEWERRHG